MYKKIKKGKFIALLLVAVLIGQVSFSMFSFGSDAIPEVQQNNTTIKENDEEATDSAIEESGDSDQETDQEKVELTDEDKSPEVKKEKVKKKIQVQALNTDTIVTPDDWSEFKDAIKDAEVNRTINIDNLISSPGSIDLSGANSINQNNDITITSTGSSDTLTGTSNTVMLNIVNNGSGKITIKDLTIDANGGTLKSTAGKFVVDNVEIPNLNSGKTALDFGGGTASIIIKDSTLKNLNGTALRGSKNELTISGSTFDTIKNYAVILLGNSKVDISQTLFNKCEGGYGSVIQMPEQGQNGANKITFNMTSCTVINSTGANEGTGYYGGVISAHKSTADMTFDKCYFKNNSTARFGGAIGNYYMTGSLVVKNSYFEGNKTTADNANGDGGAVGIFNSNQNFAVDVSIENNTFKDNTARDDGGAVFLEGINKLIKGNISNNTFQGNAGLNNYKGTLGDGGGAVQLSLGIVIDVISNTFYDNEKVDYYGGGLGYHWGNTSNGYQGPSGEITSNLFISNKGSSTNYQNVHKWNTQTKGDGNVGYDSGTAKPEALSVKSIFGKDTPLTKTGAAVGKTGNTASLYTLWIAPPADTTTAAIYAAGAGSTDGTSTDAIGQTRKANPDAGALEIGWVKFDANGGDWEGLTEGYDGTSYFPNADGSNGYIKATAPGSTVSTIDDTNLSNGAMTLKGWDTDPNETNPTYAVNETVGAEGQTLYAIWADGAIEKRNLTFSAIDTSKTYNGTTQTAISNVVIDGTLFDDHTYVQQTASAKGYDVGTYNLTFSSITIKDSLNTPVDLDEYYNITFVPGKFKINQKDITVKPVDRSKVYDGAALKANTVTVVNGLVGADKLDTSAANYGGSQTNVGTSSSTVQNVRLKHDVRGNVTSNYKLKYQPGKLTVSLNGNLKVSADNNEVTYDGNNHGIKNVSASQNSTVKYSKAQNGTYSTKMPTYTEAGTHDIWIKASKSNYKDAVTKATLKITKRPITVRPVDRSKTYDGRALTANRAQLTKGSLVKNHSLDISKATFSGSQTTVGSSNSYVKGVEIAEGRLSNYDIDYSNGSLTVTRANPVIPTDPNPIDPVDPTTTTTEVPPTDNSPANNSTNTDIKEPNTLPVEENTPTVGLGDNKVPLYGSTSNSVWALVNLILALAGIVLMVVVSIKIILRKKRNDDIRYDEYSDNYVEEVKQTKPLWLIIGAFMAVAGIVLFFLTEDMTAQMVLIDKWTIVNLLLLVLETISVIFIFKKTEENVDDEEIGTI